MVPDRAKHRIYAIKLNVIIHTPDTDVLIIDVATSSEIPGNLFIHTHCTKSEVFYEGFLQ